MKATVFHEHGGPEVLRVEDMPQPEAGPGQVLVKVGACGVNRLDLWAREGTVRAKVPCRTSPARRSPARSRRSAPA